MNTRVIIIQKLYAKFFNNDEVLSFPKHRFKKFIKDTNLKSVSQTLTAYKSNKNHKSSDKLIRNYGIGAQIIKSLNIKNMILVTRSQKKIVSLEGFGLRIIRQEIIK